jgi:asparagine synthase (glutamine-hydrolysing)
MITRQPAEVAGAAVGTMLASEVHRGPDSSGVWAQSVRGQGVAIGLRRLRILDLSVAADQPMVSTDGRYALVFNGEIYNYIELREQLKQLGATFRTNGDTEVLLEALKHWGVDAFNRLNGMWATVLIDTVKGEALFGRDRFGVKPLYMYSNGTNLWVASEVKCILESTGHKFKVNAGVVKNYVQQGLLNVGSSTFFEGIREFPAGHFARVSLSDAAAGRIEPTRFWTNSTDDVPELDEGALIEKVRETFIDAVKIRLRSDVPVGVLLSGGCDSSAIAAAVNHLHPSRTDIKLISAVAEKGQRDESPFIDAMASHIGRSVDKVVLNYAPSDAFNLISEAAFYNDEPIGGFSSIAHYLLMKRAKDLGVTVLLSGQGADESLCGYKKYLGFQLKHLVRTGKVVEAGSLLAGFASNGTVVSQLTFRHAKYYLPAWMRSTEIDISGEALRGINGRVHVGLNGHDVRQRQVLDIESLSVPALVHYEDRMSMSASREIRLPFLDYRMVSLLVPLPIRYKLRDGWTKWIFRKAMEPLMPSTITWRKDKQGFTTPQLTWLKSELREQMFTFLDEPWLSEDLGLIRRDAVRQRYNAYLGTRLGAATMGVDDIFPAIALELWARRFSSSLTN